MSWNIDRKLNFIPKSSVIDNFGENMSGKLLILIPITYNRESKSILINICKIYSIAYYIVESQDHFEKRKEIKKAFIDTEPNAMIIIGGQQHVSGQFYNTIFGNHYTDNIFQDPEHTGEFTVPVGRVYGDIDTIIHHILMVTGNSDKAVVFLPENAKDNDLAIKGIQKLGLELEIIHKYQTRFNSKLQDAEIIFQFSNSSDSNDVIHGTLNGWNSINKDIYQSKDVIGIEFNHYPLIFSQACNTGNFGTFAYHLMDARACFLGSSSPTYSFMHEIDFSDWKNNINSDGWKIGFLDLLDERQNIGEIKIEIENIFKQRLNVKSKKLIDKFLNNKTHKLHNNLEVMTVLQYQYFGNPLRYSTVGNNPDFDMEDI